jgi:microcystin-dependent protein
MPTPFIGELRILSFGFNPRYWAACNGQLLPIAQNQPLFSLLGTMYGGDGIRTFGLPNLQGRVPLHTDGGAQFPLGSTGGEQAHTLSLAELPAHGHLAVADNAPAATDGQNPASNRRLAQSVGTNVYGARAATQPMSTSTLTMTGGSQAHPNIQPFLTVQICIALAGIYPSRN